MSKTLRQQQLQQIRRLNTLRGIWATTSSSSGVTKPPRHHTALDVSTTIRKTINDVLIAQPQLKYSRAHIFNGLDISSTIYYEVIITTVLPQMR